jgi:hypothetical protein
MKSINVFYTVIVILLFEVPSLANEKLDSLNHSTFEIFVTKYAVRYNSLIDYSKINLVKR